MPFLRLIFVDTKNQTVAVGCGNDAVGVSEKTKVRSYH